MPNFKYPERVGAKASSLSVGEIPEVYIKTQISQRISRSYGHVREAGDYTFMASNPDNLTKREAEREEQRRRDNAASLSVLAAADFLKHSRAPLEPGFRLVEAIAAIPRHLAIR